jgi:hypothetical protein
MAHLEKSPEAEANEKCRCVRLVNIWGGFWEVCVQFSISFKAKKIPLNKAILHVKLDGKINYNILKNTHERKANTSFLMHAGLGFGSGRLSGIKA